MAKCTVTIDGYGDVVVKHPKAYTEETVDDVIAKAVAKTMTLTHPIQQKARFHPALGIGGYDSDGG